jgi:eukaryotic-like serine/threonine-protein kinase
VATAKTSLGMGSNKSAADRGAPADEPVTTVDLPPQGGAPAQADDEVTAIGRPVKRCPDCGESYSPDSQFCPFDGAPLADTVWVPPTDPSGDPLLGTVVDGRYRVARVLGEGGAGTVYEVVHETLGRSYAMKVLRRDVATDAALAARFIQEARTTASLKHPHVVAITDFGNLPDKTPYYVMEHLQGETLAQAVKSAGRLPTARAVRIILQVASALSAAHEAGIIHRDLKPENLFLVRGHGRDSGDPDEVRVVDFGAAKIAGARRITKTGIVFGTPHFMAPEQASGQPVDHRADIYALGVIMYQLLAGRLPFEADTLMGVLTQHMFADPVRFADDAAESDEAKLLVALEHVTMRAMAKKPEHRFQTMAALGAEVERTVAIDATGGASLTPGWRPAPRRKSEPPPGGAPRASRAPTSDAVHPSGDIAVLPRASYRGAAIAGLALGALAVVVLMVVFANRPSKAVVASHPSALAPAPSSPPPLPSTVPAVPELGSVHVSTTPSFAEIWQGGRRIGTSPMDLSFDPKSPPLRYAVRAPGFAERVVVVDAQTGPTLDVSLDRISAPPPSHGKPPSGTTRRGGSDGELVNPFAR